tara:strand:- start:1881 stop:2147 length:267 start_codon:yes stop_codon:yes gene_type:complete
MEITTDFFEDHANNLSTSFNYSFIDASEDVAKTLEPSEGDFDIMVKLAGDGFTSGEMEHISSDEKSYRLVWSIKEQYELQDELDEEEI